MAGVPLTLVVPVKRFAVAKERLSPILDPPGRADLARRLAEGVTDVAGIVAVLVCCDDEEVREWAVGRGLGVAWTPGRDLNGSVTDAVRSLADRSKIAAVVHADLPFPATLLQAVSAATENSIAIVADRHHDGTNVLAVPTSVDWSFGYGPGSYRRHLAEAARLGLGVTEVDDPALAWDVDRPEDLHPPASLGVPTWEPSVP